MHLSPKETDRLLVFAAAELARKRHAKGLRLSYPEASALITDELLEGAREGKSVAELMSLGTTVLTVDDVLPGVPKLLSTLQVEGYFPDGQKLVTVHDPIPGYTDDEDATPGAVVVADGEIELSEGREVATVEVANTGGRPVQIGSHFHFFEVNEALRFDRDRAFGMHLDIPAGTAVRFEPGDEKSVDLVALGGRRAVYGLNMRTNGPIVRDE